MIMKQVFNSIPRPAAVNLINEFKGQVEWIAHSFKGQCPEEIAQALEENVLFSVEEEQDRFVDDKPRTIAMLCSNWVSDCGSSLFTGEIACVNVETGKILHANEWGLYAEAE
jgi:hypothetical protein